VAGPSEYLWSKPSPLEQEPSANNESSEVCGIINPGQSFKLNRSQAVNFHKLLTIRFLQTVNGPSLSEFAGKCFTPNLSIDQ